ncbi:MAG: PQQ-dependent sugar dehydrogenase [Verrucomicrobiota bacterium]
MNPYTPSRVGIPFRPRTLLALFTLAATTLATYTPAHAQLGPGKLVAKRIVTGLARPVFVTSPPGDTNRIFIVEKRFSTGNTGRIQIFDKTTSTLLATPFISIAGVNNGNEEGLPGLAFHPNYDTNGHFYVYVSDNIGGRITRIIRYTADGTAPFLNATTASTSTALDIMRFSQPQGNHNGGWIGFHPTATGDARFYLYIASGDGGGADDNDSGHTAPGGNSQDITDNLLGKILRIDVGSDGSADSFPAGTPNTTDNKNYSIPATNPFVNVAGDDEIWSYGLRNPWRCSFDSGTGDFYIGDVGQNSREEIDFQPALDFAGGTPVAPNYGWRLREGEIQTPLPDPPDPPNPGGAAPADNVEPIIDYPHANPSPGGEETELADNHEPEGTTRLFQGQSVTGGTVYRGAIQWLRGAYLFGDFASDRFWQLRYNGTTITEKLQLDNDSSLFETDPPAATFNNYASISEAADGEIYICTQPQNGASDTAGTVFVITQDPFFLFRSTHYNLSELNDDSISGITADSDEDGKTTIEEFVGNTDPTVPDAPLASDTTVEPNGGADDFLTMTLIIDPDAADTVDIIGETSPDLTIGNFSDATATTTVSGGSAVTRDLVPVTPSNLRFGRFKFELK